MPTVDQPTDSLRHTLLHEKRIVICPRNLLSIHRTRVVALTAVVTTVFRFAQRVTHTGCRNLTASTDDTLSRVPRAASSTHVAKSHPRQLIRQTTPRRMHKALERLDACIYRSRLTRLATIRASHKQRPRRLPRLRFKPCPKEGLQSTRGRDRDQNLLLLLRLSALPACATRGDPHARQTSRPAVGKPLNVA